MQADAVKAVTLEGVDAVDDGRAEGVRVGVYRRIAYLY